MSDNQIAIKLILYGSLFVIYCVWRFFSRDNRTDAQVRNEKRVKTRRKPAKVALIITAAGVIGGTYCFCQALFDQWTYNKILQHGVATTGNIKAITGNSGDPYYDADLIWRDQSGSTRSYKISLSAEFMNSIRDGSYFKQDVSIKYLEDNSYARPLVIGDERGREQFARNNMLYGLGFFIGGVAFLILYLHERRSARSAQKIAETP